MAALPVEWLRLNTTYRLANAITAFSIPADENKSERGGPICELPEGADLNVCGAGFSKRTVKVRYGDAYYYVFWRDLAPASTHDQDAPASESVDLLHLAEILENRYQATTAEMSGQANKNGE